MTYNINTRQGLPADMQALLSDYPRDAWPEHPNFAASIQNWMGAHQMFKQLSDLCKNDTESFLNNDLEGDLYVKRLGRFGNLLVRNLHGHHTWEDRSFFPEIMKVDDRFDHSINMLECDHEVLDEVLNAFTNRANRAIKLATLDPSQLYDEVGQLHAHTAAINRFLNRHLADEEEIVVPIVLHHKLRG